MRKIKHPRTLKLIKNYIPKVQKSEEIEIYLNGIFKFFISKILEDINSGDFKPKMERINIEKWKKSHLHNTDSLDENYLKIDIIHFVACFSYKPSFIKALFCSALKK